MAKRSMDEFAKTSSQPEIDKTPTAVEPDTTKTIINLVNTAVELYKELEIIRNVLPLKVRSRIQRSLRKEELIGSINK